MAEVMAEIKGLIVWCGDEVGEDYTEDPASFVPRSPTYFYARVQAFIGEVGGPASDSFDLVVCSPSWYAEWSDRNPNPGGPLGYGLTAMPDTVLPGSGVWFMRRWNWADVETALRVIVAEASPGPDFGTVAARIGRLVPWEFDYKYDAHTTHKYGQPFPEQ